MEQTGPSFGRRVLAIIVIAIAAWVLLKIVISLAAAVASTVAVVLAIIGIFWAVRTLR
jgi:hypothetical protein